VLPLAIFGCFTLAGLALIFIAVYMIKPALFKIRAALWKVFTLDIEIRSPEQRMLRGKTGDGERPDP
jgi:hypothetical protein